MFVNSPTCWHLFVSLSSTSRAPVWSLPDAQRRGVGLDGCSRGQRSRFSSPRVIHTVLKNSDKCPCDILSAMVSSFLCFLLVIVLFYVAHAQY